ncbi:MAG: phosphoribosylformylglycinamidine cyclo-ligase [Deltaproteobacteria bacterium]
MSEKVTSYADAGVDVGALEGGLGKLVARLAETTTFPRKGKPVLPNGLFANVLDLGTGQGLAIGTDGVGTKLLVAHALRKYDTVGIDLIAMNVNDLLCVGAEPIAMVDYVAVPDSDPDLLEQIAIGLVEGSRQSRISIPGGEIAQVRELLATHPPDGRAGCDLVGTAVGIVPMDRIIVGEHVEPGDIVIGLPSSGLHSNGFTLARKVLATGYGAEDFAERPAELGGRSIGEELLVPTALYVKPTMALLDAGVGVKAMAHITGDGLLNLLRIQTKGIGFVLENLHEVPAVMGLIAERGGLTPAEMYLTFNMGTGFTYVIGEAEADRALELLREAGAAPLVLGRAVRDDKGGVSLPQKHLVGVGKEFREV